MTPVDPASPSAPPLRVRLGRRAAAALPGLALFLAVWGLLLTSSSREQPWADGKPIYEVAESLAHHGGVDIVTRWPPNLPLGPGGKTYALAPLLQSLIHWPGARLALAVTTRRPDLLPLMRGVGSHVGPTALCALVFVLMLALGREIGVSRGAATWGAVAATFGSYVAVYARYPYSEMLQTACFTGFFLAMLRLARAVDRRAVAWRGVALGAWAGLLADAKLVFLLSVAGCGVYLAWTWRRRPLRLLEAGAWGALTFVPLLSLVPLYNRIRWQAGTETGYGIPAAVFEGDLFAGVWGPLLSPGKSLFLFAPPLLVSVLALPRAIRRQPDLMLALGLTVLPVFFLYARFLYWSGDYAWGPRYHVFAVPALMLPGLVVVDDLIRCGQRRTRALITAGLGAVLAAGMLVQVLGSAFYWDHWIRLSRTAAGRWLGRPNITGSGTLTMPDRCGACFEEMYPLQWVPTFSAVAGHLWFMRHVPQKHDYAVAELDAPWRRYTSIPVDVRLFYGRTRLDWWYLDWKVTQPVMAKRLLIALSTGTAGAAAAFAWLSLRRSRRRRLSAVPPDDGR